MRLNRIKPVLEERGISQTWLAKRLGKSFGMVNVYACNLRLRTIIICPPHLKPQWEEYKDQFGFTASVFSSGKIEEPSIIIV